MAGKVDSHHHVWDLAVRDQPWTEGLPPLRRSFSVDDLRPHQPYVEVLLTSFGPERVMWGSDWPVCLLAASYERWLATSEELLSALSPTEKEAVFSATAERWYGLGRARSA
jgi:predicted TIM-barrel fold metal-dependent hydrolase